MIRLKPWVALVSIFVLGVITGVALTLGLGPERGGPPEAKQMQSHWMGRLNDRLHLTADQQAKIGPILADAGVQMRALHDDEVNRLSQIFAKTDAQILPLLTADQQAELKKMQSEQERDFSRHLRHWGFHRPGGPPEGGPGGPPPER